jgi:hypothetical protein
LKQVSHGFARIFTDGPGSWEISMEETRRFLYREKYPKGSTVNIARRDILEDFMRTWKFHNKLRTEQLDYAGKTGKIESVGFYHGGDVLYEIEEVPGIWHERCLETCASAS